MGQVTIYVALKCFQDKKILDVSILAKKNNNEKFLGYSIAILVMFQLLNLISYSRLEGTVVKYKINTIKNSISDNVELFNPLKRDDDGLHYTEIIQSFLAECITYELHDEKASTGDN